MPRGIIEISRFHRSGNGWLRLLPLSVLCRPFLSGYLATVTFLEREGACCNVQQRDLLDSYIKTRTSARAGYSEAVIGLLISVRCSSSVLFMAFI